MAASRQSRDINTDIPDYEYVDVNSKPFLISSFRDQWLVRLRPKDYAYEEEDKDTFNANFAAEMGVDAEMMAELKSVCSLDSLRCHPDDEQPDVEVVPPNSTLKTLIHRKKRQDQKSTQMPGNRHDLYANELERLTVGRKPEIKTDMIREGEVILTINVYYAGLSEKFNYIRPHMTLLMTGSHSLAELRDAICCVSDLQVSGEFSQTPNIAPDFISKDHFKSAFFFFEGVFYNDMRFPECQDISICMGVKTAIMGKTADLTAVQKAIIDTLKQEGTTIEWAKSHNFPPYSQAKMEDMLLRDLKIKVGFPYLYCHQGDCEHLVIITDIRLAHKEDCLDIKLYPLLTHKHRVTTQKCAVCHVFIGRWYTTNDQFAPSDPCLFCDKCFRMLHYDAKGNKLGEFLAYPYVDRGAFN